MTPRERIVMHFDAQDGLVPVRITDTDHFWHWIICSGLIGALCGMALFIAIVTHSSEKPTGTPTIEEHR